MFALSTHSQAVTCKSCFSPLLDLSGFLFPPGLHLQPAAFMLAAAEFGFGMTVLRFV